MGRWIRRFALSALSLLLIAATAPARAVGSVVWSQAGLDATHSAYNREEAVLNASNVSGLVPAWQADLGGMGTSTPIVDGSLVFESTAQTGGLTAFDVSTGALIWKFRLGKDKPFFTPAVAGGTLFATSWFSADLYALDEATGTVLWTFRMGGVSNAPPSLVSADGVTTVYAAGGWSVYAVDGADGSMLWSQTPFAPYGIQGTPAVAGGVAYVIDAQPVLHAYDAITGNEIWATEPLGSGIAAPSYPVVDGGRIFVARSNEQLFAIDAATGQVLWEQMVYAASQPSAANGIVYIHWRKGYQSRLAALDEATGDVLWETVLGSSSVYTFGAGASIANGVVYSMSLAGGVVAMDAVTGEKLWRFSMSPGAGAMPAVVDGTVYAAAGKLLKFGLEGGRPG